MKYLLSVRGFLSLSILILICLTGTGCLSSTPPESVELLVAIDNTETVSTVKTTSDEVIHFIMNKTGVNLEKSYKGTITVTIIPLNGQINNIHKTIHLQKGKNYFDDIPKKRKEEQQHFFEDVKQAIADVMQDSSIYVGQSYISRPIVRELTRMSKVPAEYKAVLLISDMMDNNPQFSFYRMSPEDITKSLTKTFGACDLYGIDISCYYSPGDVEVDQHFDRVRPLWSDVLTNAGADFTYITSLQ